MGRGVKKLLRTVGLHPPEKQIRGQQSCSLFEIRAGQKLLSFFFNTNVGIFHILKVEKVDLKILRN